jgi:hypothetical protein
LTAESESAWQKLIYVLAFVRGWSDEWIIPLTRSSRLALLRSLPSLHQKRVLLAGFLIRADSDEATFLSPRFNLDGRLRAMKEKLKFELEWRVRYVVIDCLTFIRVRRDLADWYRVAGVGGGNFMMAQSLFSALNFLAKVYVRLRHRDKYFSTEEKTNAVKSAVRSLKSLEKQSALKELFPDLDFRVLLDKAALTQWKRPRPGDCADETKVFEMFVEAMDGSVDLGFLASDAGEVWRQFRNALAHMAAPKSMVESGGLTDEIRSFRRSSLGGEWICNVDRLTVDVQSVASWLCEKIDQETDEARITDTLDWLLDAPGASDCRSITAATTMTTSSVTTRTGLHGSTVFSVIHIPLPLGIRRIPS